MDDFYIDNHHFQSKKAKHNKNKNKKFADDKISHKQKIRYKKSRQSQTDDEWHEWKEKYK